MTHLLALGMGSLIQVATNVMCMQEKVGCFKLLSEVCWNILKVIFKI